MQNFDNYTYFLIDIWFVEHIVYLEMQFLLDFLNQLSTCFEYVVNWSAK
jgi:hypothetical protein